MGDFKINRLFRPGPIVRLNACVGENGGPYDFFDYALGYFKGASAIVSAAERMDISVDIALYPVVYSFRHAIELCLKHLCRVIPPLFNDPPVAVATHRLSDNWKALKPYLHRQAIFYGPTTIPAIDALIEDILAFDPNGQAFRFPENHGGEPHLQGARIINLGVVKEAIAQTSEIFSSWVDTADKIREQHAQSERADA